MRGFGKAVSVVLFVSLTAGALAGCVPQSVPRAQFTATPASATPPFEATFDASASSSPSGPIVGYAWDFGDGGIGSGASVTHIYARKGAYEVALTVRDAMGATATSARTIEALNRAPVARFVPSVSIADVDEPITFDASGSYDPDGDAVQYVWDFGDGTSAAGKVVQHAFRGACDSGDRPTITLLVTDEEGAADSVTRQITVIEACDH